jgi:hypothetical protein
LVRQFDPTRPVVIDGGDALLDNSLPVVGNHDLEQAKRDYPDEAYTLSKAYARPDGWDPWPIARDKPLFLGESFFANGAPPAAYSEVLGEAAFLGRAAASPGVTRFARMSSEGYRTHGVAAFYFWFAEGADADHHKAWQPVAAFTREWNTAWPAGVKYPRTLTVFNDTRDPSAVTWDPAGKLPLPILTLVRGLPAADPRRALLAASGLKFTGSDDPVAALETGEVAIVDGTRGNLAKLVAEPEKLKAFAESGRKLMLWGVTPEGLADFNQLVGFDRAMRSFKVERVAFPPVRDALVAGLSLRDVALESSEKIYPWAGDRYPAADTFAHVIDLDDAAPFVASAGYADGWSKLTNGLTSADSWKFVFYHDQSGETPMVF